MHPDGWVPCSRMRGEPRDYFGANCFPVPQIPKPKWWQFRKRLRLRRLLWIPAVRWWQVWRWWRLLTPRYWRLRHIRFPRVGRSDGHYTADDLVRVQPMTARTSKIIFWDWKVGSDKAAE